MSDFTCQASVYRVDWDAEDACDLPATGYVRDVEFGGDWPACTTHRDRNTGVRADLVDLLARRPELRDVGIAGYLVDSALNDDATLRQWTPRRVYGYALAVDLMRHAARPLDMAIFRGEWTA